MNIITIDAAQIGCTDAPLLLGYAGEDSVEAVDFDFSSWAEEYGAGAITLEIMRASDTAPYTPLLTIDGTTARWTISDVDTARRGPGVAQFIFTPEDKKKKSAVFKFYVGKSIRSDDDADPWQDLLNRLEELLGEMQQQAADTRENAEAADQSAQAADQSAQDAASSESNAEAWAVGERGGEPVSESDPTYENNAKYWAENISGQLEDYRTAADQDAIDSAQDGKINALTNLLNKKQSKITANGILKGDGNGGISAAVPGMDYLPTSALYAYRSAIKQDEIDNAQNANIAKNADDIAGVKTTADAALQPAALAPYRTAADQDTIDNAQAADIAAINDKIPSAASKNNKLVAWSTFNGQLGTKQAKITANGILKGDGAGGVSAAVAGTDYLAPSALDAYRTAAAQDEIDAAQDEDIADVEAAVDQKAPIIIDSASGNIASFDDGADNMPVKQLTVNVEPIQDLHGYDSPWPAGGGKNLYAGVLSAITMSGVTVEPTSDGEIWIHGSPTISSDYIHFNIGAVVSQRALNQTVTVSINEKTAGIGFTFAGPGSLNFTLSDTVTTKTAAYGSSTGECYINVRYDVGTIDKKYKVQIEIGSTATSWTPYSNICPISGRTSATVTRTGKNLLNPNDCVDGMYIAANNMIFQNISGASVYYAFVKPNTTYSLSADKGDRTVVCSCNAIPANNGEIKRLILNAGTFTLPKTFTTAADEAIIAIYVNRNAETKPTQIQLELGSTASAYKPYQGNTYTIQLGDTVYGGTLDVTGGVLRVTHKSYTFNGTEQFNVTINTQVESFSYFRWYGTAFTNVITDWNTYNYAILSDYRIKNQLTYWHSGGIASQGGGNCTAWTVKNLAGLCIRNDAYSDAETFKASLIGMTMVYALATPIEITLTPTQIETLLGTNNILSDAGAVDVDYCADTKLYIQNIHQPTENDMTADAQIASGKYFLVCGNLYKSTTVIPAGDTIIPGTNCIKTNLAEALNALNA